MAETRNVEFLIIGGGIAGLSCAYELAKFGRVALLEREDALGRQTTGRSAAQFIQSYGGALVRPLNAISRKFFDNPPDGFADTAILAPRPVLYIAHESELGMLDELGRDVGEDARHIDSAEIRRMVPILKPEYAVRGYVEESACDIEVNLLMDCYRTKLTKELGGEIALAAGITSIEHRAGTWTIETGNTTWTADVVIDAAGAWADEVAELAGAPRLGLMPMRRSVVLADPPTAPNGSVLDGFLKWPCVYNTSKEPPQSEVETEETRRFYFKPEGGRLMISPANKNPAALTRDLQPKEGDIGAAFDRFNDASTYAVNYPKHPRAGFRTFSTDDAPVIGFDATAEGFFWLAGQGGFGIQSAPATAQLAAALASRSPLPDAFRGFDHERLSPRRFARGG